MTFAPSVAIHVGFLDNVRPRDGAPGDHHPTVGCAALFDRKESVSAIAVGE